MARARSEPIVGASHPRPHKGEFPNHQRHLDGRPDKALQGRPGLDRSDPRRARGTIFGFLGPNGAGKTTALKILAGLARPTAGRATLNGADVSAAGDHRRELGYLSQDPRFYGWMTGREPSATSLASTASDGDASAASTSLLERVGIAEAGDRRTSTYSGGMRQRLGIAQALVGRPAVILLDEPVSALDPIGRKDVLDLMRELKGETTVFYSTHILDDVQRVSDHVAILDHGRLIKAAPTQVLLGSFTKDTLRVVVGGADETTEAGLRSLAGVASVAVSSSDGATTTFDVVDARRGLDRRPTLDHRFRRVHGPDAHLQHRGDARSRDSLLRLIDQKEVAA